MHSAARDSAARQKPATRLGRARAWIAARLDPLKPGPWAWSGAALAALAAGTVCVVAEGGDLLFGLGDATDVAVGVFVYGAGVLICALLVLLLAWLVRLVPLRVVGCVGGAFAAIVVFQVLVHGVDPRVWVLGALIPLETLLGLSIGAIAGGELFGSSPLKKLGVVTLFVVTVAINLAGVVWLAGPGSDSHLPAARAAVQGPPQIVAEDPGARGPLLIRTMTYGSGDDGRRAEFGPTVDVKTESVDGSLLLSDMKGFRASAREWFWGFDATRLPLNGRVWYPAGDGPYPLVLVVHGNHAMEDFSDPGYGYLCEHLASRGFIAVSVDENFLNVSWSGDLEGKEMPARAWILLEHLKQWRAWNSAANHPLHGKVDLDNIALVGHSRGGEAVAVAAALNRLPRHPDNALLRFDFGFSIRALVALAPSYEFYKPSGKPVRLSQVDYLVLQGAHDADVSTFMGSCQYQDVACQGDEPHFKCALYVDRANHGQFNTQWGLRDWSGATHHLQNVKPLVSGDDQRQIGKVFITAMLEASLRKNRAYLPLLRDPRSGAQWLPPASYAARYDDSTTVAISTFEEDIDVTTATLPRATQEATGVNQWREELVPLRGGDDQNNKAVFLKWDKSESLDDAQPAEYRITLPSPLEPAPSAGAQLQFALAAAEASEAPAGVTIRLETADGTVEFPLDRAGGAPTEFPSQISKLPWLEGLSLKPFEIVLRSYRVPLAEFSGQAAPLDPTKLRAIVFRFDRKAAGAIYLDDVGFAADLP